MHDATFFTIKINPCFVCKSHQILAGGQRHFNGLDGVAFIIFEVIEQIPSSMNIYANWVSGVQTARNNAAFQVTSSI